MGDSIYQYWENEDRVKIIHFLYDLNQPYSCAQWGNQGTISVPSISTGISSSDGSKIQEWFPTDTAGLYPITIFINQHMQVVHIEHSSLGLNDVNYIIECMLDGM